MKISPYVSRCTARAWFSRISSSSARNVHAISCRDLIPANIADTENRLSRRSRSPSRSIFSATVKRSAKISRSSSLFTFFNASLNALIRSKSPTSCSATSGSFPSTASAPSRPKMSSRRASSASRCSAASLNFLYSTSCRTRSHRGSSSSSSSSGRSSTGSSIRLLIIINVAAITRNSPATFRSSIFISSMYWMYCAVIFSIGMSWISSSSFLIR